MKVVRWASGRRAGTRLGHDLTAFIDRLEKYKRTDVRVIAGDARDQVSILQAAEASRT